MAELMTRPDIRINDVVQIDPAHDNRFGGSFLIVTEVKSWGVQGFVPMGVYNAGGEGSHLPQDAPPSACQAFYRVPYDKFVFIGRAAWTTHEEAESEDAK